MKIEVKVIDGPIHMNTGIARELEECFHAVAHRLGKWPDERPRSRTTSGLIVAHKDVLIGIELTQSPRVKVIRRVEEAKK